MTIEYLIEVSLFERRSRSERRSINRRTLKLWVWNHAANISKIEFLYNLYTISLQKCAQYDWRNNTYWIQQILPHFTTKELIQMKTRLNIWPRSFFRPLELHLYLTRCNTCKTELNNCSYLSISFWAHFHVGIREILVKKQYRKLLMFIFFQFF